MKKENKEKFMTNALCIEIIKKSAKKHLERFDECMRRISELREEMRKIEEEDG